MTTGEDDAAIQAANNLGQSVVGLREEISTLRVFGRQSRHLILGLGISLVLDVLLSIVVAVLAIQAGATSQRAAAATSLANQNKQTATATCRASNEARAANVKLWDYVLDLSAQSPQRTAQEHAQITQLRQYLASVFAQRNCDLPQQPALDLPPPPTVPSR